LQLIPEQSFLTVSLHSIFPPKSLFTGDFWKTPLSSTLTWHPGGTLPILILFSKWWRSPVLDFWHRSIADCDWDEFLKHCRLFLLLGIREPPSFTLFLSYLKFDVEKSTQIFFFLLIVKWFRHFLLKSPLLGALFFFFFFVTLLWNFRRFSECFWLYSLSLLRTCSMVFDDRVFRGIQGEQPGMTIAWLFITNRAQQFWIKISGGLSRVKCSISVDRERSSSQIGWVCMGLKGVLFCSD
jgi:hypothetical protein